MHAVICIYSIFRDSIIEIVIVFQHLGSVMMYKNTPFVVLTVSSFGFDLGTDDQSEKLESYKRWKDIPYNVDHIEISDIRRYGKPVEKVRKIYVRK